MPITCSAVSALDMKTGERAGWDMPPVPALPVRPVLSTQKQVADLTAKLEEMKMDREELKREILAEMQARQDASFDAAAIASGHGELLKEKGRKAVMDKVLGIG